MSVLLLCWHREAEVRFRILRDYGVVVMAAMGQGHSMVTQIAWLVRHAIVVCFFVKLTSAWKLPYVDMAVLALPI